MPNNYANMPTIAIIALLLTPVAAGAPESFAVLQAQHEAKEKQAVETIRREYLAALDDYLLARPKAGDREDAHAARVELARTLELHAQVEKSAVAYLKEFPEGGKKTTEIMTARFLSLLEDAATIGAASDLLKQWQEDFGLDANGLITHRLQFVDALLRFDRVEDAGDELETVMEMEEVKASAAAMNFLTKKRQSFEHIGKPFTDFSGQGIDGNPVDSKKLRGKVVLVDFWATWCGPCIRELPSVRDAYERFHDKGFEIVGVSLDKDAQKLADFVKERNIPWPQLCDTKGFAGDLAMDNNVHAIPDMILVDQQGKIYRRGVRGPDLHQAIEDLLGRAPKK